MIDINTLLKAAAFSTPTEVQEVAYPILTSSESLIVTSPTGTGKTHAFLFPIFSKTVFDGTLKVLILAPTRELASQIDTAVNDLVAALKLDVKTALLVGGTDKKRASKDADILIGTPGRLYDVVYKEGQYSLANLEMIIFDEADMLFDQSFLSEVDQIIGKINKIPQIGVFSATINKPLMAFISKYLDGAKKIELNLSEFFKTKFDQYILLTPEAKKTQLLSNIITSVTPYMALVFFNKKEKLEVVADILRSEGIRFGVLHGGLSSRERRQVLKRMKNLEYTYVLASDIASRGIDIEGVSHVINYDIPAEFVYYIHRIGRSGRMHMKGTVYTLLTQNEWQKVASKFEQYKLPYQFGQFKDGLVIEQSRRDMQQTLSENEKAVVSKVGARKNKKVKPGYKKKQAQKAKTALFEAKKRNQRQEARQERKMKKQAR